MAEDKEKLSIVDQAKKRYQRAHDAYSTDRQQAIQDTQFVLGDSENKWQWPEDVYSKRAETLGKPCLTINVTAQHCNQIINNIRQNRPAGKVLPVDNAADPDTAEILGGLIRSIQSHSNADTAHDIAAEHAIYGGEGFWRVLTEYESDDSFDQVISIKPLVNPQLIYIDPDAIEPDRSDAKWGFIFEDLSKEQCAEEYPGVDVGSWVDDGNKGWVKKDAVRIAEYFWCEYKEETLCLFGDGSTAFKSEIPEGVPVQIIKERTVQKKQWYWAKLIGGETEPYDKKEWPGIYLPIVTVVGKEINVNGKIVRKGIVRDLKDAARIVNYSYSAAVESIALQNKVPYLTASESIEGYEDIWASANIDNRAYLPWNAYDENGNALPKPEKQQPATMPTAQVQMLQLSVEEMRAASGQQNANFGIRSEAQSGVGIQRLKAQGEIATFHFPDNLARALTYEMRVLIDLIPKVYDTRRVIRILGLDGKEKKAILDPQLQGPYAEAAGEEAKEVQRIFNPLVGRYDVQVDTGPSYHTQRQEASEALTQLAQANPQLMQVAGDIVMRAYDFPMADELAKRLEKTLPPGMKEQEGQPDLPPEVMQQLQQADQQVQQMDQVIQKMTEEIQQKEEDARSADLKAQQAQSKVIELQIQMERDDAIRQIQDAMTPQAEPQQAQPQPQQAQQPPMVYVDAQGQMANAITPLIGEFLGSIAESVASTGNAVAVLAEGQQAMMQQMANDNAVTQSILAEVARPKQSQIQVVKQADGSFVGMKVES